MNFSAAGIFMRSSPAAAGRRHFNKLALYQLYDGYGSHRLPLILAKSLHAWLVNLHNSSEMDNLTMTFFMA